MNDTASFSKNSSILTLRSSNLASLIISSDFSKISSNSKLIYELSNSEASVSYEIYNLFKIKFGKGLSFLSDYYSYWFSVSYIAESYYWYNYSNYYFSSLIAILFLFF